MSPKMIASPVESVAMALDSVEALPPKKVESRSEGKPPFVTVGLKAAMKAF